jgi:hypothetical protein
VIPFIFLPCHALHRRTVLFAFVTGIAAASRDLAGLPVTTASQLLWLALAVAAFKATVGTAVVFSATLLIISTTRRFARLGGGFAGKFRIGAAEHTAHAVIVAQRGTANTIDFARKGIVATFTAGCTALIRQSARRFGLARAVLTSVTAVAAFAISTALSAVGGTRRLALTVAVGDHASLRNLILATTDKFTALPSCGTSGQVHACFDAVVVDTRQTTAAGKVFTALLSLVLADRRALASAHSGVLILEALGTLTAFTQSAGFVFGDAFRDGAALFVATAHVLAFQTVAAIIRHFARTEFGVALFDNAALLGAATFRNAGHAVAAIRLALTEVPFVKTSGLLGQTLVRKADRVAFETSTAVRVGSAHTEFVVARGSSSGSCATIVGGGCLLNTNESGINDAGDFIVTGFLDLRTDILEELIECVAEWELAVTNIVLIINALGERKERFVFVDAPVFDAILVTILTQARVDIRRNRKWLAITIHPVVHGVAIGVTPQSAEGIHIGNPSVHVKEASVVGVMHVGLDLETGGGIHNVDAAPGEFENNIIGTSSVRNFALDTVNEKEHFASVVDRVAVSSKGGILEGETDFNFGNGAFVLHDNTFDTRPGPSWSGNTGQEAESGLHLTASDGGLHQNEFTTGLAIETETIVRLHVSAYRTT